MSESTLNVGSDPCRVLGSTSLRKALLCAQSLVISLVAFCSSPIAVVVTKCRDHSCLHLGIGIPRLLSLDCSARISTAKANQLRTRTLLPFFLGKEVLIGVKLQMGGVAAAASGPGMCHM